VERVGDDDQDEAEALGEWAEAHLLGEVVGGQGAPVQEAEEPRGARGEEAWRRRWRSVNGLDRFRQQQRRRWGSGLSGRVGAYGSSPEC
jgi:hypothetical protein